MIAAAIKFLKTTWRGVTNFFQGWREFALVFQQIKNRWYEGGLSSILLWVNHSWSQLLILFSVWVVTVTFIGLVAFEATDSLSWALSHFQSVYFSSETFITGEEAFGSNSTFEEKPDLGELDEAPKEGEPKEGINSKKEDGADSARLIRVAVYVVVLVIAFWTWGGGPWGY